MKKLPGFSFNESVFIRKPLSPVRVPFFKIASQNTKTKKLIELL
jgi:hypothetical protein